LSKDKRRLRRPVRAQVLEAVPTKQFERDVKRMGKRGKHLPKLYNVITMLCQNRPLEARHRDHALTGDWEGWRDCHFRR
jgi:mRNA interferase YafQ